MLLENIESYVNRWVKIPFGQLPLACDKTSVIKINISLWLMYVLKGIPILNTK